MIKVFKVAHIKALEKRVALEEITYSRMVEIMNDMANRAIEESLNIGRELGVSASDDEHGVYTGLGNGMRSDQTQDSSGEAVKSTLGKRIDSGSLVTYTRSCIDCKMLFTSDNEFDHVCSDCDQTEES